MGRKSKQKLRGRTENLPAPAATSEPPSPPPRVAGAVRLAFLGLLLAVAASLTLSYLWNEDFWWYLSSGQAVLAAHGIPRPDPFLYTAAEPGAWVYHSWLWTVLVALVHGAAGLPGVMVLAFAMAAALTVLVFTSPRLDRYGLVNAALATLVLAAAHQRLCLKSEMVTWVLLAAYCLILERKAGFTARIAVLLAVLQWLWANLHGGYPLGLFAAACYAAGGRLQDRFSGQESPGPGKRWPPLWLVPVLIAVSFVTPSSSWSEKMEPFGLVLRSASQQPMGGADSPLVSEWQSPFAGSDPALLWIYLILLGFGAASFVVARRPRSLPRLLLLAGTALLGATAVRHVTGLAVVAALVGMSNLAERPVQARRRATAATAPAARPWTRWAYPAACAALAVFLASAAVGLRLSRTDFEAGQTAGDFFTANPQTIAPAAVDFVRKNRLPGPIFNDYIMGAFVAYRLHPDYKAFIDNRVLDPQSVVEYSRIVSDPTRFADAQARWGFRTVILNNFSKTVRSPLGAELLRDPAWRLVYTDPLAVVFVRGPAPGVPEVHTLYAQGPGGRVPFLPGPASFAGRAARRMGHLFFRNDPSPFLIEYLSMLGQIGRPADVETLATRALETAPADALVLRQRCAARLALGKPRSALDDCRQAQSLRHDDVGILTLYAVALGQNGRMQEAFDQLRHAQALAPADPQIEAVRRSLMSRRG